MQQLSQLLGWKSNHSIDKGKKYQVCAWGYLRDPFFWASSFCSFSRSAFKLIGFFWCTSFSCWRKRTEEEMNPVSRKRACSNITQTSVVALYALQRNWYWPKKLGYKIQKWLKSFFFASDPQGKKAYFLFSLHASPKSLLCTILRANSE